MSSKRVDLQGAEKLLQIVAVSYISILTLSSSLTSKHNLLQHHLPPGDHAELWSGARLVHRCHQGCQQDRHWLRRRHGGVEVGQREACGQSGHQQWWVLVLLWCYFDVCCVICLDFIWSLCVDNISRMSTSHSTHSWSNHVFLLSFTCCCFLIFFLGKLVWAQGHDIQTMSVKGG